MLPQFESERDNFDQWVTELLEAGCKETGPSDLVWQRIASRARCSLLLQELVPGIKAAELAKYAPYDGGSEDIYTRLGMDRLWLHPKLLPYA